MSQWRRLAVLVLLACFTTAYAQDATCSDMVREALKTVEAACAPTGRNQACYGNVSLAATPREGVPSLSFRKQGDVADVADLASLQLQQLDVEKHIWGIALMKLQASLPDTLPGQNVTFLLFGDVKITNAVTGDGAATPAGGESALRPMQAFYFSTGISQSNCTAAPASGILIQTPKGAGKVALRANDVDIQLGSTAFLRAQPAGKMTVSVVEGEGILTSDGESVTVPAGTESQIPMDEDLQADGAPEEPQAYDESEVLDLPVELMPEDIEIAPPNEEYADDGSDSGTLDDSGDFGDDQSDGDTLDNSEDFGDDQSLDSVDANVDDSLFSDDTAESEDDAGYYEDTTSDESYDQSGDDGGGSWDEGDSGSSDDGGE